MEMRVMKKGDSLLNPASIGTEKDTHIAYIEVLSTSGTPGYEEYFKDVAKKWMELGGIPHWHKQWSFLTPPTSDSSSEESIYDYIKRKYGADRLGTFNKVRKVLDPNDIFLNETMEKVLK